MRTVVRIAELVEPDPNDGSTVQERQKVCGWILSQAIRVKIAPYREIDNVLQFA